MNVCRYFFLSLTAALLLIPATAEEPTTSPADAKSESLKVLLFSATGWYRHPKIPAINGWLVKFGAENNMELHVSESAKDINKKNLEQYDVILLNNCNSLDKVLEEKQRRVFEAWYQDGGGIAAIHAVLVRQEGWPWLLDLNGCDFNSDSDFFSQFPLKSKFIRF